jgi:protein O-mannosyl-transferase
MLSNLHIVTGTQTAFNRMKPVLAPARLEQSASLWPIRWWSLLRHNWQRDCLASLWLLVLCVGIYWPGLPGVFLLDDRPAISENPGVQGTASIWSVISSSGRPVADLSFRFNSQITGLTPLGLRAGNILIHLLCGICLYFIILLAFRVWQQARQLPGTSADVDRAVALVGATLFIVHPIQTAAVTYVVQRHESLMALWFLLGIYSVLRGELSSSSRLLWQVAAVGSALLSLLTKQVGITFGPVCLLLICGLTGPTWRSFWAGLLLPRATLWLGLAVVTGHGLYMAIPVASPAAATASSLSAAASILNPNSQTTQSTNQGLSTSGQLANNNTSAGFGYRSITPIEYAQSQPAIVLHYLRLICWPQSLCFDYGWPVARTIGDALPGIVGMVVLIVGIIFVSMRWPWCGWLAAMGAIVLLPSSSILPIRDLAFEHRVYLPMASLSVMFGLLVVNLYQIERLRRILPVLVGVIVLALATRTVVRQYDYRTETGMWRLVTQQRPENIRAWHNFAEALHRAGRPDAAIEPFRIARDLSRAAVTNPPIERLQAAEIANGLGSALLELRRVEPALAAFDEAASYNCLIPVLPHNRGNCLAILGRVDEAIDSYALATMLMPEDARVQVDWGNLLVADGHPGEAIPLFNRAIALQPTAASPFLGRGQAYVTMEAFDLAARDFIAALERLPAHSPDRDGVTQWLNAYRQGLSQGLFGKPTTLQGAP